MTSGGERSLHLLVTRPRAPSRPLLSAAANFGFTVDWMPLTEIQTVVLPDAHARLASVDQYDAVTFTSANGVRGFEQNCRAAGRSVPTSLRCFAVGRATARAAAEIGMNAVEVAPDASAEAFGAWLGDKLTVPSRLLWPCGQRARSEFAEELSARGHSVHPLVCYNTVERAVDRAAWKRWMEAVDRIHVLMFYSPSAVASWRRQPMVEAVSAQVRLAAVGKTTAAALAAGGLPVWCVSTQPDDEAFVETIADCWQRSFTCKETEGESS